MSEVDTGSDWTAVLLIGWFVIGLVMAIVVSMIAQGKNRDGVGWGLLGFFFGFFALLAVLIVPEVARVPRGMISATCPRCNAKQNVKRAESSYDCWQCHLVSPTPQGQPTPARLTPEQEATQREQFKQSYPYRGARIGVIVGFAWTFISAFFKFASSPDYDDLAMMIQGAIVAMILGTLICGLVGSGIGAIVGKIRAPSN